MRHQGGEKPGSPRPAPKSHTQQAKLRRIEKSLSIASLLLSGYTAKPTSASLYNNEAPGRLWAGQEVVIFTGFAKIGFMAGDVAAREYTLPANMVRRSPPDPGESMETVEAALDRLAGYRCRVEARRV
jgi:hypothetical protein